MSTSAPWRAPSANALGANVPRRRPAADASSLISHQGHSHPTFRLALRPTSKSGKPVKSAISSPAWPAGLRGEIKEEAFAAGECRGTFKPEERRGGKEGGGTGGARW